MLSDNVVGALLDRRRQGEPVSKSSPTPAFDRDPTAAELEKAAAPPAGDAAPAALAKATAGSAVRRHRESGHTEAVEFQNGFLWARSTDPSVARFVGDGLAALAEMRP